jgi:hypothetical protein
VPLYLLVVAATVSRAVPLDFPAECVVTDVGACVQGGGGGEYASTFVSSFFYFDTLGTLAQLNHSVTARQTLVGGNYELLRCSSGQAAGPEPTAGCDFEPHPDYWIALLWRRLMGSTVLLTPTVHGGDAAALRVHAHCTAQPAKPGSVTLAFANMDESVTFSIDGSASSIISGARTEYRLKQANSSQPLEEARELMFNDSPAPLVVGTGALPALVGGKAVAGASLIVAPATIGWAVFADAKAPACM